jgi:hypothetical protein
MNGKILIDDAYSDGFYYDSSYRGNNIGVGSPVYYNETSGLWVGAVNDSVGDNVASHIVVAEEDNGFRVASHGIFDITGADITSTAFSGLGNIVSHSYYYLSPDSGVVSDVGGEAPRLWQPLFYALDSNTLDVSVGVPVNRAVLTLSFDSAQGVLSDIRHKENIESLSLSGVETVNALNPVTFDFKEPSSRAQKGQQLGFIAQEIGEVLPQTIYTIDNEEQTVMLKPDAIIPVLTKAVQELTQEVSELKKKLEDLNG